MADAKSCLLFALALVCSCNCYKILVVFPFPGVSHGILGEAMVRPLLEDGHEVTYITSCLLKQPPANLTQVDVSSLFGLMRDLGLSITTFIETSLDVRDYTNVLSAMNSITTKALLHENVQKLIHDPKANFDLVIAEWMYSEMYSGFAAVYDCPFIWSSSMDPHWFVLRLIDEIPNPAFTSDNFSDAVPPFSFLERVKELWTVLKVHYFYWTTMDSIERDSYTAAFKSAVEKRGRSLPPLDIIKYNASLMFGNSHVSTGMSTRLPQSYKPIGGYHISDKIEPLTGDMKIIMDSSNNGVIYFSMGSVLQSKDMPDKLRDEVIEMFGSLKQTVIWKFEANIENLPKNVHVTKWAPQRSILAHPNTVLFITHGGLLSITEAVCFKVPIIGIPGFADQSLNVNRAMMKGFAKRVDLNYDLPKNMKTAIDEMLRNPKYKDTIQHLSKIYHTRPTSPQEEIKQLARLVVKTKGAAHLKSLALFVPWYEKMYLDLAVIVLLALTVLLVIVNKISCHVSVGVNKVKMS